MTHPRLSALAIAEVAKRLGRYREIEKLVKERFAVVPGQRVAVRRLEVVEAVAEGLSKPWERVQCGPQLHLEVRETLTLMGARAVKRENRRLFLHVMRIGDPIDEAMTRSADLLRVRDW